MRRIQKNRIPDFSGKPLLLYDGNCDFCLRWAKRAYGLTLKHIDYLPYQREIARFPEIPQKEMERYVQLIEPGGTVYQGAAAAFRMAAYRPWLSFLFWLYLHVPLFALASEKIYDGVSRNRHRLSKK